MPPETGLEMATRNGAKAAGWDERIGAIEVGKEADIVLFDTDRPEWQPLINPVSNLVYSAPEIPCATCSSRASTWSPTDT
jgi:Cytosine deaminase and related metal-dependent hydrolases